MKKRKKYYKKQFTECKVHVQSTGTLENCLLKEDTDADLYPSLRTLYFFRVSGFEKTER